MSDRGLLNCALLALALLAPAAKAQLPTGMTQEEALRLLQSRPDLVRERLQQSGLSSSEIRQRLASAGLQPSLLDPFLSEGVSGGTAAVSGDVIRALDILGVPAVLPQGVTTLALSAGTELIPGGPPRPASRLFGLSVFQGRTTQFQPLLTGPVPEAYQVGPGDVMVLVLTGDVELVHQLQVTREGFIVIPQVGQLYVGNVTMAQLRALLEERLGRSYSGIRRGTTHFDITIARLRTIQVFVIGEVAQPSAYQLSSVATVLNALYAAGGPTELGNFRQIQVQRGNQVVATLDLYEYLLQGKATNDVILQQGDVVFVPLHGSRVSINGAAVRPAVYELAQGQTLADLVPMAGGLRPDALLRRLAVYRILPPGERPPGPMPRAVIDVPLQVTGRGLDARQAAAPSAPPALFLPFSAPVTIPALPLENGDSVVVDSVLPPTGSLSVSVGGMVNKPGSYPWSKGITMRDLVRLARGPSVGADLREAEIARLPEDRTGGALANTFRVPLDSTYLFERDSAGAYLGPPGLDFPAPGSAPEMELKPYDQVTIFRQPGFEFQRTAWITGEVKFPGPYALTRKDERVTDLVRRAGGMLPSAYLDGARFFRSLDTAGRVNLDLTTALGRPGQADDLMLQPGDSLAIPEYIPIVKVVGAVNSPTSVRYERGKDFNYYVSNAGGYTNNADKGRASVRYADGSARVRGKFLFFTSSPDPGPGSTIVVPFRPEGERGIDLAVLFGGISQVLSAVTTIILVVDRLR